MNTYIEIIKFNFLKYLAYPLETASAIVNKLIGFGVLALFWSVVAVSSNSSVDFWHITGYFLLTGAVHDLVFARDYKFGRSVQKAIKNGEISNYMIRPTRLIPHLFADRFVGQFGIHLVMGVVFLAAGLIITPPQSWVNILVFLGFFSAAIPTSIALNVFLASWQFYTTEAGGLRNVFSHISRLLSGALVPIHFFPDGIRQVVEVLPFASIIYGPVNALQTAEFTSRTYVTLGFAAMWAILLPVLVFAFWNKSIKGYDAVGI